MEGRTAGWRTAGLTILAMIAFAGNSVLCRAALGEGAIDPVSFTIVRLVSGALTLAMVLRLRTVRREAGSRGWASAITLCIYAMTFSLAYVSLDTGAGALILFGSVQLTMLAAALMRGEQISAPEWLGVTAAIAGFAYLVLPGASAPAPLGSLLMGIAGVGWGLYSLQGRGSSDPLAETAHNFTRCLPFAVVLAIAVAGRQSLSVPGVLLAATSGAVTSGLGYTIWYTALRGLTTTTAAVVQLSVPVIAAAGGILFVGESLSLRLTISAALILGGIAVVVLAAAHRRVGRSGDPGRDRARRAS